jgi:hypothetical protein
MRAIVPVETGVGGGSRTPALSTRAIQKTSASSTLGREKPDTDGGQEKPLRKVQVERLYRDDTPRFDPFWDGPRLVPAFVTQLLGQAMPERRETVMLESAYGCAVSPRTALLLDRKS